MFLYRFEEVRVCIRHVMHGKCGPSASPRLWIWRTPGHKVIKSRFVCDQLHISHRVIVLNFEHMETTMFTFTHTLHIDIVQIRSIELHSPSVSQDSKYLGKSSRRWEWGYDLVLLLVEQPLPRLACVLKPQDPNSFGSSAI